MAGGVKFDAEFIDRRMREHRQLQELALEVLVEGAIEDVKRWLVERRRRRGVVLRRVLPLQSSPRLLPREGQSGETD
jgi:hypothetical protein